MFNEISRTRLISVWFATAALISASILAMGVNVAAGTTAILAAMSLVPPAIMLILWRGAPPQTARDIMYSASSPKEGRP